MHYIFFFNDTATTEIYTLSLHDALPISPPASGGSRGSTVAWGPALRRQTRRLEVVRRSPPRHVPALPPRRVGGLLRLDVLQHGRQPLVVNDRAGLHCLDLVEQLEIERRSVELNREPPVRGNSPPPPSCAPSRGLGA